MRWFVTENHAVSATLLSLEQSIGFCPAHARRLLAEGGPEVLRLPWKFTVRGAIGWAERLAARPGTGRRRRDPPRRPCPLCQVITRRESAARGDLAASLGNPEVGAAVRDRGGLCYRHFQDLLPGLSPASATVAASAVAVLLATMPPGTHQAALAVAGHDFDALARAPYLDAHASALLAERPAGRSAAISSRAPAERMIADLRADSCPICRGAAREETRYLRWLGEHRPGNGPASPDLHLCGKHLHDACSTGDAGPLVTGARAAAARGPAAARGQAAALAAAAASLARTPHSGKGRPRASRGKSNRGAPLKAFRAAAQQLIDDDYCRACQVSTSAATRQQALLQACLQDSRVLRALEESHGLCLRHGTQAADSEAAPILGRLLTQLQQAQWELEEDARKQAWDHRHERRGHEQSTWRLLPALLDGDVFLGIAPQGPTR
jgi:hypothetical protein